MLLSIFVNTANSFILLLALFPLLGRVINRVFHLARILLMALETRFYTYCSKTAHSWHTSPQTLLTLTLPCAYFSLDFTLKIACSSDTYQRLGCLDIFFFLGVGGGRGWEELNMNDYSPQCWSQAVKPCKENSHLWEWFKVLPFSSISVLRP